MIPKYPFQVTVTYKHSHSSDGSKHRETHNYETLQGATAYATIVIRKPLVTKCSILVVLEEITKGGSTHDTKN